MILKLVIKVNFPRTFENGYPTYKKFIEEKVEEEVSLRDRDISKSPLGLAGEAVVSLDVKQRLLEMVPVR